MSILRSRIVGIGSYLPDHIMTNEELAKNINTTDAWIVERTGIRERRIAAPSELTSDLATAAAKQALISAKLTEKDIELIILATSTPDNTFPSTATRVQAKLGMTKGVAFDLQAVCSGFIFALSVADNFIKSGQIKTALVIGAESFSRILDWNDRSTCVLFGDGAGAVILKAEYGSGNIQDNGILSTNIHSDGRYYNLLRVDGGPSSTQTVGYIRMEGRRVFRYATINLVKVAYEILKINNLTIADLDWIIPHQANKRIIEETARKLRIPLDKMIMTIDRYANTSAASVPITFTEAINDGRIKIGQLILLEAMGGGFTWGATLIRL
ncbi:MAG: ketoacyl-ACP synthase III [Rhodospirillaceae bacterium]|nr:ketoacyl-ACP synthase III [Rhodospirillaceae bacterium]